MRKRCVITSDLYQKQRWSFNGIHNYFLVLCDCSRHVFAQVYFYAKAHVISLSGVRGRCLYFFSFDLQVPGGGFHLRQRCGFVNGYSNSGYLAGHYR